jgi:homoserine kinase
MNEIRVFSPATVANLSCGFDILGACLDKVGDEIVVRKKRERGIVITKVTGQKLTKDININVAGVSASALLKETDVNCGFEIEIHKGVKPGSGIGSSAASAAGSVFAINQLIGKPYSNKELIKFAMEGEKVACGSLIADNVAAALLGGFTFVRDGSAYDYFKLSTPSELVFTIIHPQIEVRTKDSRAILKKDISLKEMTEQSANIGSFIAGLYTEDYELIGRSIKDNVIEPLRSKLIPKFNELQKTSLSNGALGCGISGSGPSVFALSKGFSTANNIALSMKEIYDKIDIEFDIHVSPINDIGIKIIEIK